MIEEDKIIYHSDICEVVEKKMVESTYGQPDKVAIRYHIIYCGNMFLSTTFRELAIRTGTALSIFDVHIEPLMKKHGYRGI